MTVSLMKISLHCVNDERDVQGDSENDKISLVKRDSMNILRILRLRPIFSHIL